MSDRVFRLLAPLACFATLAAGLAAAEPAPPLVAARLNGCDRAVVSGDAEQAVVAIASERGIGRLRLRPGPDQPWPREIVLRIAIGNLEGFTAESETLQLRCGIKTPDAEVSRRGGPDEEWTPDPETMIHVEMQRTDAAVEVVLPPQLKKGMPEEIEVQWIDWYRG